MTDGTRWTYFEITNYFSNLQVLPMLQCRKSLQYFMSMCIVREYWVQWERTQRSCEDYSWQEPSCLRLQIFICKFGCFWNASSISCHFIIWRFLLSTQRDLQAQQPAHKSGCKCRKSMCLKKYCECFEASLPCSSTCTCVDCHNTINDMSRNAERLSLVENADMEVLPVQATRY